MEDRDVQENPSVWVDWEKRVISFSGAEGFEELQFQTREEKFRFVARKGIEGFGIQ